MFELFIKKFPICPRCGSDWNCNENAKGYDVISFIGRFIYCGQQCGMHVWSTTAPTITIPLSIFYFTNSFGISNNEINMRYNVINKKIIYPNTINFKLAMWHLNPTDLSFNNFSIMHFCEIQNKWIDNSFNSKVPFDATDERIETILKTLVFS